MRCIMEMTSHSSHNAEQLQNSGIDKVLMFSADAIAEVVENLFERVKKIPF